MENVLTIALDRDLTLGASFFRSEMHFFFLQGFVMEVMDAKTHITVANTTNARDPAFTVTGLRPGVGYIVSVNSYNSKGHSEPMRIHAFTLKAAQAASSATANG